MTSQAALTDYWNGIASTAYGLRKGIGQEWCVALTGDSRAQASGIQTLGGAPCYDIGMPGIAINEAVTFIPPAVKNLGPRVTVIQLGVNLTWIPLSDPQWSAVIQDTTALINACRAWSPHIILTTPIPMEKGFPAQTDADCVQRCLWLSTIRDQMCEAAIALGVPIVDLFTMFRGGVDAAGSPDGTATRGTTWDGTHLVAATYDKIAAALHPVVAAVFPT
jgi:lysophospholipase L1-like esterase